MTPQQLGLFGELRNEAIKKTRKGSERKWIRQVIWALQAPKLNSPGGWCESAPPWMSEYLTLDRLTHLIKGVREDGLISTTSLLDMGYYLYGASMVAPLGHDWTDIIMRVQATLLRKWNPFAWEPEKMDRLMKSTLSCDHVSWSGESLEDLGGHKKAMFMDLRHSMFTRQMSHVNDMMKGSRMVTTIADTMFNETPQDVPPKQEKLI